ncbi:MAG TPA: nuclear transport factor 2 family protein [Saprospiraceae bacterium]|nr:nuclear transport factor 2 family protein [Saprospiraceae bacterium]HNT21631.1 nuclear transport factor 2 family protein [Saprospiraceae bacterium]
MKSLICLLLLLAGVAPLHAQALSEQENSVLRLSAEKFNYLNPENLDRLEPFLHDRLVFIHSNAMTETKEQMFRNLRDGKWKLRKVDVREASVRIFRKKTAVVVGKGTFYASNAGHDIDIDLYYTETWVLDKKKWRLASRHASRL